jgi:hypothetical protein
MYFKSKKIRLIIVALIAIACSKIVFFLINDPEGPNLLIVIGLAVIIFFVFLGVSRLLNNK